MEDPGNIAYEFPARALDKTWLGPRTQQQNAAIALAANVRRQLIVRLGAPTVDHRIVGPHALRRP